MIDGSPEQYITLHTGYDYDEKYDINKKVQEELDALLDTIFPDKSVKDFYLSCVFLCLFVCICFEILIV